MPSDRVKNLLRQLSAAIRPSNWGGLKVSFVGLLAFLAGNLTSPTIGQWGARLAKVLGPPPKDVLVAACAPLQEARLILRMGVGEQTEIVADKRVDFMNETQILIRKDMDSKLSNVRVLVYPIFSSGESEKTLFTIMYAGALLGSSSYSVERKKDFYVIKAPVLHAGENFHIQNHLSQPASYIIELTSDELTRKATFAPGCLRGFPEKFKITVPTTLFKYVSEDCKGKSDSDVISCISKSPSIDIPERARGKELIAEYVVFEYGKRR